MALYRLAQASAVTTSGNAAADVACSTGPRPKIFEWDLFISAATASTFSLRRSTALGTRTSPIALNPEDPSDPTLTGISLVDSAVAFSVQPTLATPNLARIALPATIGTGVIWTFPRGVVVANSLSLCAVCEATNGASVHTIIADI